MSNEVLLILSALVDILFITFAARRGIEWLLGSVVVNLLLVGIFGGKLVEIFGLVTNAGNVFYACVFLATHFLLERYGKNTALKTIWFGTAFILFFIVMSRFSVEFSGLATSVVENNAIRTLFSFSSRITFASILSYVFAQYVNIFIFNWLKIRTKGKFLWLRSNGANITSQLADSLIFFSIAFFDLPGPLLVQTILAGWLIKIIVVALATPFMYFEARLAHKKT